MVPTTCFVNHKAKARVGLLIDMNFVGRKREIAAVTKSLKQNINVVMTGRYGVGRSCLVKHIAKLNFLRDLRLDSDLLFVAITESFLPEADLFRLRSTLCPSDMLTLHNLKRKETVAFFRNFSRRKRLGWSESFIKMLAASTEGYALLMQERAQREAGLSPKGKNLSKARRH
jgi:hypothetical protein